MSEEEKELYKSLKGVAEELIQANYSSLMQHTSCKTWSWVPMHCGLFAGHACLFWHTSIGICQTVVFIFYIFHGPLGEPLSKIEQCHIPVRLPI